METIKKERWKELKEQYNVSLLLFRCGDFYESYYEDAERCAKILDITLSKTDDIYMAGFPCHALDTYLPKLVRAGLKVAISDHNEIKNSKSTTTMAKAIKAADLIGKSIIVGDNVATIEIMSADGDVLNGVFKKGDVATSMPLNVAQVQNMLNSGIWHIEDTKSEPKAEKKADAPKAEKKADAPKAEKKAEPKAEKKAAPKAEKKAAPKAEKKAAPKTEKKAEPKTGKYSFVEYTNKKRKTCGRINGVGEQDDVYTNAAELHASASYEKTKNGKAFFLIFGPRYVAAGREVCEALNAGKSLAELKAIVDKATEERAARREEWKQKREEYKENKASEPADATTYTAEDVARLLDGVLSGKPIPKEIQALMKAKAA